MDVSEIDKNFTVEKSSGFDADVYDVSKPPFTIYGGFVERKRKFEKMPFKEAEKIGAGVLWGSGCGAGIRITFSTDSKNIRLRAKIRNKCYSINMPFLSTACFTLKEDENGKSRLVGSFITDDNDGVNECDGYLKLKGEKLRDYVLYLPLYSGADDIFVYLDKGCKINRYEKFAGRPKILYYGSSVTQGACASRADNTYQEIISESKGFDYTILGFSGGAKAEAGMISALKKADCDIFVCCYDHNAPNEDYLSATHEKLYKTFRENPLHKNVPVIFLSKTYDKNDTEMKKRFNVIRRTYLNAKRAGENVYLIDGGKIYPENLREHCAVDGCHPTDLGFYFIAKAIIKTIGSIEKSWNT